MQSFNRNVGGYFKTVLLANVSRVTHVCMLIVIAGSSRKGAIWVKVTLRAQVGWLSHVVFLLNVRVKLLRLIVKDVTLYQLAVLRTSKMVFTSNCLCKMYTEC